MKKMSIYALIPLLAFCFHACENKPSGAKAEESNAAEAAPPASHYEHLKELSWLVGQWEDADVNIDVKYICEWDLNKSLLVQQFDLQMPKSDTLTGKQLIGWDPAEQKIRSWIFDSDGGFGNSEWSKDGDAWYATMAFTMPAGELASATHIYTKIDDNAYTFASVNRNIGGTLLPNIGPFQVIRKK